MTSRRQASSYAFTLALGALLSGTASAQVPDAIAAPGESVVATFHAEGAIIRSCACPLELRAERTGIECARCAAPIVPRGEGACSASTS